MEIRLSSVIKWDIGLNVVCTIPNACNVYQTNHFTVLQKKTWLVISMIAENSTPDSETLCLQKEFYLINICYSIYLIQRFTESKLLELSSWMYMGSSCNYSVLSV